MTGNPFPKRLSHLGNAGQRVRDRTGRSQLAARLATPVDNRPAGREQRQHHYEAHPHTESRHDAEVPNYANGREQGRQQADYRRDGGQRQRDRHVAQSPSHRFDNGLALNALFPVVRNCLDRVVHREADYHDGHHRRERARRSYQAEPIRPDPALRSDNPGY